MLSLCLMAVMEGRFMFGSEYVLLVKVQVRSRRARGLRSRRESECRNVDKESKGSRRESEF